MEVKNADGKTAHTVGMWVWMRGAERGFRLHGGPIDGKKTLVMISGSRNGSLKDTPNLYDAALIAAAPELLEALLAITEAAEWHGDMAPFQAKARAAIRKATESA